MIVYGRNLPITNQTLKSPRPTKADRIDSCKHGQKDSKASVLFSLNTQRW